MSVIAARLREKHAVNRNRDIRVIPLFDHVVGARTSRGVWLGFGAVMSLLAIACANVGGLLIAGPRGGDGIDCPVRSWRGESGSSASFWPKASACGPSPVSLVFCWRTDRSALVLVYGPRTLPRMEQTELDLAALAVAFVGGIAVVHPQRNNSRR